MKLGVIAAAAALLSAAPPAATIDELAWMAGRWEMTAGERWTEEYWSAPRGGMMVGYGRSGESGAAQAFEFLRIAPGEDGRLAYHASPDGRPAVAFPMISNDGDSVTFANPAHDHPQRIHYRRDGDGLVATISAEDGSSASTWRFRRSE